MAWAFVNASEKVFTDPDTRVAAITVPKPAGVAENHLLVWPVVLNHNLLSEVSDPSGWTRGPDREYSGSNAVTLIAFYKIAGASEPADYTCSWTTTEGAVSGMVAYSGIVTASPLDVSGEGEGDSNTPISPTVTTTVTNDLIIRIMGADGGGGGLAPTTSDETLRGEDFSTFDQALSVGYAIADSNQASAGATGTSTFDMAGAGSEQWCAFTMAFKETVVGGGTPMHYFRRRHGVWLPKREKLVA